MECKACGATVSELKGGLPTDLLGVCQGCQAVYLKNERHFLAMEWCSCEKTEADQIVFFWSQDGRHGWLHSVCGQVTQTG